MKNTKKLNVSATAMFTNVGLFQSKAIQGDACSTRSIHLPQDVSTHFCSTKSVFLPQDTQGNLCASFIMLPASDDSESIKLER